MTKKKLDIDDMFRALAAEQERRARIEKEWGVKVSPRVLEELAGARLPDESAIEHRSRLFRIHRAWLATARVRQPDFEGWKRAVYIETFDGARHKARYRMLKVLEKARGDIAGELFAAETDAEDAAVWKLVHHIIDLEILFDTEAPTAWGARSVESVLLDTCVVTMSRAGLKLKSIVGFVEAEFAHTKGFYESRGPKKLAHAVEQRVSRWRDKPLDDLESLYLDKGKAKPWTALKKAFEEMARSPDEKFAANARRALSEFAKHKI